MSSKPEAGEQDAREDGPDLHDYREAGEIVADSSDDLAPDFTPSAEEIEQEDVIPELAEEESIQQNAATRSFESLQERREQTSSLQLRDSSPGADETSSVPDETLSIQVLLFP